MPEHDGRRWFLSLITEATKAFAGKYFNTEIDEHTYRVKCADGLRRDLYECSLEDVAFFLNRELDTNLAPTLIFCVFVSVSDGRPVRVQSVEEGFLVQDRNLPKEGAFHSLWGFFSARPR